MNEWMKHRGVLEQPLALPGSAKYLTFSPTTFGLSFLWKISPTGHGEMRQWSRRSASGVKEKCVWGKGEMFPLNVWYSAEALLLDQWQSFPLPQTQFSFTPDTLLLDPQRTSPWPLTLTLDRRAYFSELNRAKSPWKNISNIFWTKPDILKYLYAFLTKS